MEKKESIYTRQFWLLCSSSFLFFGSFNMIVPELPAYLSSMGGEDYKGLIIALFTLTAGLSRPFSGKLTDSIGRVPVMVYGVLVCVICGLCYPILNTVSGFLFLRFIHGMSTGFKPTATSAFLADVAPANKRGEAMGILGLFGNLGMASGLGFGSIIASNYSINTLFYVSSATAFLSILVLIGIKETLEQKKPFSLQLLRIAPSEVIEPKVFIPSVVMMFSVFAFGVVLTIVPDFSEFLGIENKGLFFVVFTIASISIRVFAGKASDRYGRVPVLRIALLLMVISLSIIGFSRSITVLLFAAVLFGWANGMNLPTLFAWTIDLSDDRFRGRGIATVYISLEIGIGVGALMAGWIYDNEPANFKYAFWSSALSSFLGFLFLMWMTNRPKRKGGQVLI